jgi:hypothetical protein
MGWLTERVAASRTSPRKLVKVGISVALVRSPGTEDTKSPASEAHVPPLADSALADLSCCPYVGDAELAATQRIAGQYRRSRGWLAARKPNNDYDTRKDLQQTDAGVDDDGDGCGV